MDAQRIETKLGTCADFDFADETNSSPQRQTFLQNSSQRDKDLFNTVYIAPSRSSRPNSPSVNGSGYVTPREAREEAWRHESDAQAKPGKVEMREMYKELGGRKARGKSKFGASGGSGSRDRGGWGEGHDEGW